MTIGLLLLSFVLCVTGISIFRKLSAGNSRLLDIPNERSSHSTPVTRGAGIAIVTTVLGMYVATFGTAANISYIVAATVIAIVSFLDDLFSVPILIRLTVHFFAACLLVYFSGSYLEISLTWSNFSFPFGPIAPWITVIFIVWTINAFNFMDGIDGIAGIQGGGAGVGWLLFGISTGVSGYSTIGAILIGTCSGFLVFNWHPAKVFMGDVGSTFLGFTLAVIPLMGGTDATNIPPSALGATIIFLWLFMFDTVITRARQVIRLRPFWKPHRDHLYQRIVIGSRSHRAVAGFFGIVALALAVAFSLTGTIGTAPLSVLLLVSPAALFIWAREKKIDVS